MHSIRSWFITTTRSGGPTRFLFASLILGILVGIGAAVLVLAISAVGDLTTAAANALPGQRALILVAAVPIGMFLTWVTDQRIGPGVAGGGVSETMMGLALDAGYLPTRLVPGKIIGTAFSLGSGASGGREGPIVLIGAALGSSFARHTRFGQDEIRSLVAAGAGAGLGAVFNAPIAGMLFALEVVLGSLAVKHLNAVVIVSVAAAVTTHTLVESDTFLRGPAYQLEDPRQLILFVALAVLTVGFGYLFLLILHLTEETTLPSLPRWVRPVTAGLIVGLIGYARPEVLGTGQSFLRDLLQSTDSAGLAWWLLLTIAAVKVVAAAITHASGGSVGSFMPAMVVGGAVGAGFAALVGPWWTVSTINPGAFALVGMAATLTVVARAPLTAILLVFELTGDYGMVLPLMLATIIATLLADFVHPDNAYTMSLKDKGVHLPQTEDVDLLDTVSVREVMSWVPWVPPTMPVDELRRLLDEGHHHGVPVVQDGHLVGIVTVTDVSAAEDTAEMTVGQIMTARPITATPTMPVSAALARMASLGVGRLPVLDEHGNLVGMFRRESVVRAYHTALSTSTGRELYRARTNVRSQAGAAFFEVSVTSGSALSDQELRTVAWPEGATLVSVRRGQSVIIPRGSTIIRAGDDLTFYGTFEAREEVSRLAAATTDDTGSQVGPQPA